jgi:hypothetical protein
MAVQAVTKPGLIAGKTPFETETIPHGLSPKDLDLPQVQLVALELFEEFNQAKKMYDKALIAFSISYLCKNKQITPNDVLPIKASIELTKFFVTQAENFVCRVD